MKTLRIAFIGLMGVCLFAGVASAKPDGDNKHDNHGAVAKAAAHEAKTLRMQARLQKEQVRGTEHEIAPADAPGSRASSPKSTEEALAKLDHARWAYNPNDTRGQGNMGKVDMLNPYGQDRDDRLALYGNRGRVIREAEPPEEPPVVDPPVEPPQDDPPVEPPADWPPF